METLKNVELEISTQHEYIKSLNMIIAELKKGKLEFRDWLTMRGAEIELEITKRNQNSLKERLKIEIKNAFSK